MRKSLLKTPPSGPSSIAGRAAALAAGGAPPRAAAKRNGTALYTDIPRVRVAVETGAGGDADMLAARVRLLEVFIARAELSDCTQLALQWLAETLGLMRSICLVRPEGEQSLFLIGSYG